MSIPYNDNDKIENIDTYWEIIIYKKSRSDISADGSLSIISYRARGNEG